MRCIHASATHRTGHRRRPALPFYGLFVTDRTSRSGQVAGDSHAYRKRSTVVPRAGRDYARVSTLPRTATNVSLAPSSVGSSLDLPPLHRYTIVTRERGRGASSLFPRRRRGVPTRTECDRPWGSPQAERGMRPRGPGPDHRRPACKFSRSVKDSVFVRCPNAGSTPHKAADAAHRRAPPRARTAASPAVPVPFT